VPLKGAVYRNYIFTLSNIKRIRNEFTGVLTGKGLAYGGSLICTSYRLRSSLFFETDAKTIGQSINGNSLISDLVTLLGDALKVNDLGGKCSFLVHGYIYDEEGISGQIDFMLEMRARGDNRAEAYLENIQKLNLQRKSVWEVKVDIAIPATQNELNEEDAKKLTVGYLCNGSSKYAMYQKQSNNFES
jgi:glutamate dehydrogenase (NADP+)